ncbi:MAG: NAD(P)/FAD-dependent oxidoreductase [Rhodospirillales bacterium]|nr:NAD(P)/FAD-dependent oxidoreductase [Rhodospirillales bacterium]
MSEFDVIVIGGGAAGLMCAIEAGKRGRSVLVLDHAPNIGEKIRISGGGRCNFTNRVISPDNYLSENPRFCVSALRRYGPSDFIALLERYGIAYHERALGQLFCDDSAKQIVDMLLAECLDANVRIQTAATIQSVQKTSDGFSVATSKGAFDSDSLVVATGGRSIPKIGASGFGYDLARQFGLKIVPTRPGLVPLVFDSALLERFRPLSGISLHVVVRCGKAHFAEALLFTHRGISGPAILQVSSYWREGEAIRIDLRPGTDVFSVLKEAKINRPKQQPLTVLSEILPRRLAQIICEPLVAPSALADTPDKVLRVLADAINDWKVVPSGDEGYRVAEVTLGGVDTSEISSKTFEANAVPGLYFIGEVVDVTGHLGGYNFQWAWSSGHAAGQFA